MHVSPGYAIFLQLEPTGKASISETNLRSSLELREIRPATRLVCLPAFAPFLGAVEHHLKPRTKSTKETHARVSVRWKVQRGAHEAKNNTFAGVLFRSHVQIQAGKSGSAQ